VLEGFTDATAMLRPGVYALLREGVVVYIGQSKQPLSRVYSHKSLWGRKRTPGWLPIKGILFDEVHVLSCKVEDLDRLERALIDLYKPKYNVKLKAPTPVATEFTITIGDITVPFNPRPASPPILRRF